MTGLQQMAGLSICESPTPPSTSPLHCPKPAYNLCIEYSSFGDNQLQLAQAKHTACAKAHDMLCSTAGAHWAPENKVAASASAAIET